MKYLCIALLLSMSVVLAQPADSDSCWISYYNGIDGWFSFQGPQKAMILHPHELGVEYPFEVESLKTWFYAGMGSWTDSVFTFRIYGNNGTVLLWESESLTVHRNSLWFYYGLPNSVKIDSGDLYIAMTYRTVDGQGFGHPYTNVDDNGSASHSLYGTPGNWSVASAGGEYCFFAYVTHVQVGLQEQGRWVGRNRLDLLPSTAHGVLELRGTEPATLFDANGRRVLNLVPGPNDVTRLSPGIYFGSAGHETDRVLIAR